MRIHFYQYFRNQLSRPKQKVYDQLFTNMANMVNHIAISPLPVADIKEIIRYILLDNPALFYVNLYCFHVRTTPLCSNVQIDYFNSKAEAQIVLKKMKLWIEQIKNKTTNLCPWDKSITIYDMLGATVCYRDGNNFAPHTLYGAVVDHNAVCEGIAKAFKFLCDNANIPCIVVVGTLSDGTSEEKHAWNMIQLDGKWGHVDLTPDISSMYSHIGFLSHARYFRSDDEMKPYKWNRSEYPLCTYKGGNWFIRNNMVTTDLNMMRGLMQNLIVSKKFTSICMQISFLSSNTPTKKILDYISQAVPVGYKYTVMLDEMFQVAAIKINS